jgi:two-component system, LuxR family, sensor kinase FixL
MTEDNKLEIQTEIERLKAKIAVKNKEIKKLKTTNLFMESLFNGIDEEIMVMDNNFRINEINKAFLERCGLKRSEVIGRRCRDIKERPWAPCLTDSSLCPTLRASRSGESIEISHAYKDPESREKKDYVTIAYPLKDEDEEIRYFLEISRDVTEYRQLISKLQRSEKRLKAIVDTATDAIISIDEHQKIILFNNAAQKIFGYSGKDMLGKDVSILLPSIYGSHTRYIKRFLEKKDSSIIGKTISLTAVRNGGELFPIELSLSYLELEEKIIFTAIIRDKTEEQKMKSKMLQSERLAAVGEAVAHVAHEIKNPLMIIGGFSSQIRSNTEDEKARQKLDMVLDEVSRLERLAADLGDFTKAYKLVKRPASLNSVIKDVVQIMSGICAPEKYTFKKFLSDDIDEIECDPDKLRQVFINIISNGLEAMQNGGTISITTEKTPNGVEVRIADEGTGIPQDKIRNIFEPFYTTREHGSGLGLSISYKLVEAHNGEIWALSKPGQGTTFVIQLPASW